MTRPVHHLAAGAAALALLALGTAPARADRLAVPQLKAYQQECAACHLAYPPGLLPAASWQRLVAGLPQHFGTDASVDPATARQLAEWLSANAGTYKKVARDPSPPPQDRITRSAWFVHEHGEVPAATWQRPAIKSPANCAACHTQAEQGDFRERKLRIPR